MVVSLNISETDAIILDAIVRASGTSLDEMVQFQGVEQTIRSGLSQAAERMIHQKGARPAELVAELQLWAKEAEEARAKAAEAKAVEAAEA